MADEINYVETDSAKLYTTIIGSLMDSCGEALYPGDERRIFGEALVAAFVSLYSLFNDSAKQRTLRYARGVVLDAIGERLNVYRLQPESASATFRFTASAAISENIVIPAGTRITTDGSVYFATQNAAVLPAGSLSVDLLGVCMNGGSVYNGFAAGTIATLVDLIPFIASAVNITDSTGGNDGEPYTTEGDDKLRERIRLAPSALSTAGAENSYRYFALSADPDVVDVSIDCPEDAPNTVNIYPLMTGGELPDEETMEKVLEAVNSAERRPMTDLVSILQPTQVSYQVELKYYCTKDQETATIQSIEGTGGAIDQFNAWQTAALARNINPDQLRRFVLAPSTGTGALRVDIIKPVFTELTKTQVAKLSSTPVVTHEVVAG